MAFPWEGIGNFLGGAGTAAGAVAGILGKKGNNVNDYGQTIDEYWYRTMNQAKMYGIHPLAAMGMRPSGGPTARPSDLPNQLHNMGQGLERMLTGRSEIQKAQVRLLNAQAAQIEKRLKPTIDGQTNSIHEEDIPGTGHPGFDDIKPLETLYRDSQGLLHNMPNQDAADYMSESWMENIPYQLRKFWSRTKAGHRSFVPAEVSKMRDFLDDLELGFKHKLKKDEYLTYNYKYGLPQIVTQKIGEPRYLSTRPLNGRWVPRYQGHGSWRNLPRVRR